MDIRNILDSTGLALERQATAAFGNVVDEFVRGTLGSSPDAASPQERTRIRQDPRTWYATSYAAALAGSTSYRPKLKFLFKIEFVFKPGVIEGLLNGGLIDSKMKQSIETNEFTFMVKSVDRPKVDFEYEDDVNEYNFRTNVLKRIRHRELTVTFMDDVGNRVFDFFRILMMIHSPITRRQMFRTDATTLPTSNSITSGNGMNFTSPGDRDYDNTAHRSVINTNFGGAIEIIRVKQMYVNPGVSSYLDAPGAVIFDFMNPRLVSFDLDDLTHELSDPNLLTMQFDYDWMEMIKVEKMNATPGPTYNITTPGVVGAPVDVIEGAELSSSGFAQSGGLGSQIGSILSRQAGRAGQVLTSEAINRAVRSVAGGGRFATAIGGVVSNSLGGAVNGIVDAASRDILGGIVSGATSSFSRATSALVRDSAVVGGASAGVSRSSTAYDTTNPAAGDGNFDGFTSP